MEEGQATAWDGATVSTQVGCETGELPQASNRGQLWDVVCLFSLLQPLKPHLACSQTAGCASESAAVDEATRLSQQRHKGRETLIRQKEQVTLAEGH